jgi:hypothetical protein
MVSGCSFSNKPPYLQENVKEIAGLEKLSEVAKVLGSLDVPILSLERRLQDGKKCSRLRGPKAKVN